MSSQTIHLVVTFLVIIVGCIVGKIRLFRVSLDIAAVLILAIVSGIIIDAFCDTCDLSIYRGNMQFLSSLGSSMFVPAIGLTAGYSIKGGLKRGVKYVLIGSLMTVISFTTMCVIHILDDSISFSSLIGVMCGALTSTPGLSAACEIKKITSSATVAGYSVAYFIGVVFTVFVSQAMSNNSERKELHNISCDEKPESFLVFVLQLLGVAVLGSVVGNIKIPIFGISLGATGGMLCVGLAVGSFVEKFYKQHRITRHSINLYRNIGLALFFVGTGIPSGMSFLENFSIKYIVYGAMLSFMPILLVCIISYIKTKKDLCSSLVAGGMTSTPALGVLLTQNKCVDLEAYSLSYVGALVATVFLIRCLVPIIM